LKPDTTLATTRLKSKKKDKEQLTMVLCANANGTDKFKPFVIGKSPNLQCFKCVKYNKLGITYESSSKAWITTVLFQTWLKDFDLKMANRILPVVQNEEPTNNDNDNELMEEMKEDIEALNLRNAMSFEVYINYPEEENTNEILNDQEILTLVTNIKLKKNLNDDNSEDEDDSKEIPLITHHEALNAIEILEQYFIQQDLNNKV
ncbi:14269_t:CDS:2, partial [Gigaspora margarita]